jgi:putative acetyltransferase
VGDIKNITIRPAIIPDAEVISILIVKTIRETNANDYDEAAIELICAQFTTSKVIEKLSSRAMFIAEANKKIVGTISLGRDKLHSLFVLPECQYKGVGTMLVHYVEQVAVVEGRSLIELSSSVTARAFYRKLGYIELRFEPHANGSTYRMQKFLA